MSLFRRYWSPLSCKHIPRFPPFERAHAACSTTNGSAKTSGANTTVNGYLIYILYSVVLLARASYLPSLRKL
jgi:hypothetical protein